MPSIALKREFLAVDVTVSSAHPMWKFWQFRELHVPEIIEWE